MDLQSFHWELVAWIHPQPSALFLSRLKEQSGQKFPQNPTFAHPLAVLARSLWLSKNFKIELKLPSALFHVILDPFNQTFLPGSLVTVLLTPNIPPVRLFRLEHPASASSLTSLPSSS
ncbi:hypothetical protein DV515_00007204, partial [Chloebia gouldiae]